MDNLVLSLYTSRDGTLWIGTLGGVSRYESGAFTNLTRKDGLAHNWVYAIHEDSDGILWFGTIVGLSRYEAGHFTDMPTELLKLHNTVVCIHQDTDSVLWFGSWGDGVARYDGQHVVNFTVEDGLANNAISCIHRASDGLLWIGTPAGVSLYDGETWSSLDSRDGLAGDLVASIAEGADGAVWLGTNKGLTRYVRGETRPDVEIVSVGTDKVFSTIHGSLRVRTGQRVVIKYRASDFRTLPEKQLYRWQLVPSGSDSRWSVTHEPMFEHVFQSPGIYTFQVQAIDRDLNYSEPASVELTVVNPFYLRAAFLVPTVGGGSILLIVAVISSAVAIRRRRQVRTYERYAARELQDARQMQMALMPMQAPAIDGAEIAGRCVTANTVGGDFFSYLPGGSNREVGLVIADVAGHAMKGAMNAVMTDGILHMAVKEKGSRSPAELLQEVNDVLSFRMESDMNVTMVIALLDTQAMTLTLANAAHHAWPLLVRDGTVTELKARGLPLGMKAGVQYREEIYDLQHGDILVLMTDGIIEARAANGTLYGDSGRLERLLAGFAVDMNVQEMVDAVINDTIDFCNNRREDDMSIVITKLGNVA